MVILSNRLVAAFLPNRAVVRGSVSAAIILSLVLVGMTSFCGWSGLSRSRTTGYGLVKVTFPIVTSPPTSIMLGRETPHQFFAERRCLKASVFASISSQQVTLVVRLCSRSASETSEGDADDNRRDRRGWIGYGPERDQRSS
jgi:hypothetical protein